MSAPQPHVYQLGHELPLPRMEVELASAAVGRIRHVLRRATTATIIGLKQTRVSPRKVETAYVLSSGETILVVTRKLASVPADVDGIIYVDATDVALWQHHKAISDLRSRWLADPIEVKAAIAETWRRSFHLNAGDLTRPAAPGQLRPPQLGALCALAAHWSLYTSAATVVMPTGTGKTETMIAAFVGYMTGTCLVIVPPSRALRDQTTRKFLELGLLRDLGVLDASAPNPIVGVLEHRPKTPEDLEFVKSCHVVIAIVNTVAQGSSLNVLKELAAACSCLVLDEAHHVAASSWTTLRNHFRDIRTLQFTATPFRRDGEPVDGKIIFNYPLQRAQVDGYFRPIHFRGLFELDAKAADEKLANQAIKQLRADTKAGYSHVIMARCGSIERARTVFPIYERLAKDLRPVLIHSDDRANMKALDLVRDGTSRIVVCVDMLGEGFDFPRLKIAAIHDNHKSLGVLLQFTGRFTRSATDPIGDAHVFANTADRNVSLSLERLYSEDADWNKLLADFSSEAIADQERLLEFLADTERVDTPDPEEPTAPLTAKSLKPKLSTLIYTCAEFHPDRFINGLSPEDGVFAVWRNRKQGVLAFVRRTTPQVDWCNVRSLRDRTWDLVVAFFDQPRKLLFIAASDRDSNFADLAEAVGGADVLQIRGDTIFRTLGGISRLLFQNVGLKRHGRRNLRFSMYSGTDVAHALSPTQKASSTKSNVFGTGFEGGAPVSIGCSYKGRVWCREQSRIPDFVRWAREIGAKLRDESISTDNVIDNVMMPTEIERLPEKMVLCLDWPRELLERQEERVRISTPGGPETLLYSYTIEMAPPNEHSTDSLQFVVRNETHAATYALNVGGATGFSIVRISGDDLVITIGRTSTNLTDWFFECPPSILYVDGSELEGNALIELRGQKLQPVPSANIAVWDWTGVDLQVESIWKNGKRRSGSVQERACRQLEAEGFDTIVDDDGAGEAADLVCIKEVSDHIQLALVHCKYSGREDVGQRVKDVVEVCSQAVRSSRWIWRFDDLCRHLLAREADRLRGGGPSRLLRGDTQQIRRALQASRFKEVRASIVIVQPGLSKASVTDAQATILTGAHSYLMDTVQVGLHVACST